MNKLAIGALLFIASVPMFGTTRYIAQSAGTFTGGTACNGHTAITPATFNSTTNAAGDINWICGTITLAANTTALQLNQSGTSGNPITIIFDSGAVLTAPAWPPNGTSGAIDLGNNSWITINGQGTSTGGGGGIIQATLNGDPGATCLGGPCTLHGDSNAIEGGTNSTNITVEGLSIIDMYVATAPNPGGGTCMYEHGNISGWVVQNNFMHDVGWCVSFQYDSGPSNGVTIANNQIYNIDHGIALGGPSASQTLENVKIYGNNIHDYSNWDDPADNWHHDGIHIWGQGNSGTDTINNVWIYNNKFGGCIGAHVTAHIFIEANSGGTTNVYGFNNVLTDTCNGTDNDGMITTGQDGGAKWYNNTVQSISTNSDVCVGTSSSPNVTYINNVATGCTQGLMYLNGGSVLSGGLHNNIYAAGPGNCASGGDDCWRYGSNSWQGTFSTWQSQSGQDASPSAYVTSANLTSSGVPNSGSAVLGAGANLTSLCTGNLAPLCSDINGNARPSSGAWDVGAYEGSGGTPTASTPTFSPVASTYSSTQSVTISASTGGVICYNTTGSPATNGTTGCTTGTHYTSPVSVASNETLYAVAGGTGYLDSTVGSAAYVILTGAATPTFSPVAGTYTGTQTVTISTSSGTVICYNTTGSPATNGTTGCTTGTKYTTPVSVAASETLYATAGGTGFSDSSVGSAAYTITSPAAATPTFSPVAGTYAGTQSLTLSTATSGCSGSIYWSTVHNPPTTGDTQGTAVSVAASETVYAKVLSCGGFTDSSVGSAAYTITTPVTATPTFSPSTGTYTSVQTVTISDATAGSTIYYTTNGSMPTTGSTVYTTPITVGTTQTVKALAAASGYTNSVVGSAVYTINLGPTASTSITGTVNITGATQF